MKRSGVILFLLLLFFTFASPAVSPAAKVAIVASIFPVADMVREVGAPYVEASFVIPAGASPHTFEPKPSQLRQMAAARVFFMVGAGLEIWAEKFAAAAGKNLLTVTLSKGIDLIASTESEHGHDGERGGAPAAAGGAVIANPHIWLDPVIAAEMVARIVTVLGGVDPAHADYYRLQGEVYLEKLAELDGRIRLAVSNFTQKKYVAFHAAWDYFARRYGLESEGIIETAPGRDPTPRSIKKIIEDIKKHRIRAVFAEPQLNPKVASVIAAEAGVRLLLLDPMGDPGLKGRGSYLELMEYNLEVLKEAMQ